VIGLDGVGLPLVQDLIARGIMPNLARIVAGGTLAPMRSSIPTISSVSWTGFTTGKNPGKHGVYGFTDMKPGTLTLFFPNFGSVRGDTMWDVAGRAGKRSIVLNIPGTYPARALNGLLVSGFVAVNLERAVHPPELLGRLKTAGYKIDVDYVNADQKPDAFFADTHAVLDARRRVYLDLIENEAWDLFIGVITECDRLHHYFWSGYADPGSPLHAKFLDVYRRLDDVLGELVAALPAGVPLFIVADHGHTLIHREYYPNAWLRQRTSCASPSTSRRARPIDPRRGSCSIREDLRASQGTLPARNGRRRRGRRPARAGARGVALRDDSRRAGGRPARLAASPATSCTTGRRSTPRPTR
jgi:predicted AlkP superfamily phosphohydrolase/phosphomutase